MAANFVSGALWFESEAALSAALRSAERTLLPALNLGVCAPRTRDIFARARRGPRAFVIDPAEALRFEDLDNLGSRLGELAGASQRGSLVIAQMGERPGLEVASRPEAQWRGDPLGQATTRWLVPTAGPMTSYRPTHPLEFAWTTLRDPSGMVRPALDVRDWAGFFGVLVECDERLSFCFADIDDRPWSFAWADLTQPGVGGLVASPGKELQVWTEVRPARELRLPTAVYPRAVEVVVRRSDVGLSVHDLAPFHRSGTIPHGSVRGASLWFVEAQGLVAVLPGE